MPLILKGVMQSPVTPLKDDFSPDLPTFEKLLDFHVRTGATAISWPHHKGESLNLTIPERKAFAEVAVKTVAGRVPVSVHVSALSVEDSIELAQHAQKIGADAIIAITPYFWSPSQDAIYEYYVRLSKSMDLPIIAYNSPSYLEGIEFTGELITRLLENVPSLVAMKEASFDSAKFLEISRAALKVRPDFSIVAGVEFLAPSVPLGCVGSYSSAGGICPNLCSQLFDACTRGDSVKARELQFKLAQLWDLFRDQYPSSLKGGMVIMGRPVGPTRPPLPTATKERQAFIAKKLEELGILDTEPHGW
ncbi:dihydrodipicolinate synthase family protein [Polynucleobacter rarus]|jgi:4-hydroxy-tetrahydrodipicolinate synthase|uniref:dihydrodipicolinate synthase family protein n=1 Tax=Polynucleobacter rarus TaxID=556055 RepID=UPI000D3E30E5|nr:dihydrodipicolinate synthase family protein [Polynucleobacter rarus]